MGAQPVTPLRILNPTLSGEDAREIIKRDASNEFVFAVVGHAGSGTSMIASTLETRIREEYLDGVRFQATIIKARGVIEEWARGNQKVLPAARAKRSLKDVELLQDYGD